MSLFPRLLGAALCVVTLGLVAPASAQTTDLAQIGPWKIQSWVINGKVDMCSAARQDPKFTGGDGGFLRLDRHDKYWEMLTDYDFGTPKQRIQVLVDGKPFPVNLEQMESVWVGRLRLEAINAMRGGRELNLNLDPTGPIVPLKDIGPALDAVERCMRTAGKADGQAAAPPPAASSAYTGVDWKSASGGVLLPGAKPAGREANGAPLYVCSAPFANGEHPGKTRPGFSGCNIGYGGKEHTVPVYKLMIGTERWVPARNGQVPPNALQAGSEADGRPLFVCRAQFRGGVHPGKIGPATNGCNIGFGGNEITIATYEVIAP